MWPMKLTILLASATLGLVSATNLPVVHAPAPATQEDHSADVRRYVMTGGKSVRASVIAIDGDRVRLKVMVAGGSGEAWYDLSAFDASARTEVDEVAGGADGVFIVFDEEEGVALFSECVKGAEEGGVVAGMKANGGFVEDVEDALEVGAKLRGEADALGFATGEGGGGAVELEVTESDLIEEVEKLVDRGILEH